MIAVVQKSVLSTGSNDSTNMMCMHDHYNDLKKTRMSFFVSIINGVLELFILKVGPQPRSYTIKAANGREYRRNRVQIKVLNNSTQPARQLVDDLFPTISSSPLAAIPPGTSVQPAAQPSATPTSRSGRAIKPPQRFNDFV
ncbi:hypothetical protein JTE90_020366 [Oedothorax gibbosus]|uniref:Uncharacterized protein n=1 Tax=Oedothorax gibbosus TaxID=931172 RepID=A0AAV6TWQ9_9ARAC|nr:hypothetical protein JTE90_020366 [Oedothorax gibbosus]